MNQEQIKKMEDAKQVEWAKKAGYNTNGPLFEKEIKKREV